jgi:hypothetical protein
MDGGLEAGRVAEIAPDDLAEPGEIARDQGRGVAMLDQPELALFCGGLRAEHFRGDAARRNFKHHEDQHGCAKHSQKHGYNTLAEE